MIAPSRIAEYFPDGLGPLPRNIEARLRANLTRLEAGDGHAVSELLDTVLEHVLGLGKPFQPETGRWLKGSEVSTEWTRRAITGEAIKPRRLWTGRRSAARVVEWLRRADLKVALLTNARQWRLIYAGLDHEAFAEADSSLWLEEGTLGIQVTALRELLSPAALIPPAKGKPSRLLAAIEATRKGQAELSSELGERVRRAVELLIREHAAGLDALVGRDKEISPRHLYLAATRVIMRMVVILFAEARDLLPRDNPIYHHSYGLSGLREILDRAPGGAGIERLRHRYGAWPRILALFRLVYAGSPHEALPVLRYGGGLFEPGDPSSKDPALRALTAFESVEKAPNDAVVSQLLQLLTRSRVRVRQGRTATWVEAPVDFSDLSSEYIGILYEGLLDFELRRVKDADPVVFLNLGDEPALPLSRLEAMEESRIGGLLEKLKLKKKAAIGEAEEESDEAEAEEAAYAELEEEEAEEAAEALAEYESGPAAPDACPDEGDKDRRQAALARAHAWARAAVIAGRVVPRPRSRKSDAIREYESKVRNAADALISRIVLPGEWYLVRFGGTRKGSGTFYTRPQLAVPTTQRTLRPLAYNPPAGTDDDSDETIPPSRWQPRKPEEILALKVCDPACGSGSFLVAALRFLTDSLLESLYHHSRIQANGEKTLVTLAEGKPGGRTLAEEVLPCRPDAEDFEQRLRARLKRHVVERCIYGVDLDPLAVELARLALWVETMDRALPFSFLDHKVKCGNSLVGCWFDRFRDYPVLAWEREGGDKGHSNGVHFQQEGWTKAIKEFRKKVKNDLADWIRVGGMLFEAVGGKRPEDIHDEGLKILEEMHSLPVHQTEERAEFYREKVLGNPALARLKEAFDTWCAVWFWPADKLEDAPLPSNLADPPETARRIVAELQRDLRFFHWELEFPDVFARPGSGFDAVVGNPPWENLQASPGEFFSNVDPLFRTYGRLESQHAMTTMFSNEAPFERSWLEYCARFKAYGNWSRHASQAFGDPDGGSTEFSLGRGGRALHSLWRQRRGLSTGYADPAHPFRYQAGGRIFTYKLFAELCHAILRDRGQMGLLMPSSIYTDRGSTELRHLFVTQCRWRWLFGFENREKVFDIDSRFKFGPVIIQKGATTRAISTAFMHRDLKDWEDGERFAIPYSREQVEHFSPKTRAILEIRDRRDLEILEKIYANSVLLGDQSKDGWGIKYALEFMMNTDAHLFPPRPKWESEGYRPDEYGRWIKGDWQPRKPGSPAPPDAPRWEIEPGIILSRDGASWIREPEPEYVALPLYEGRMIGQFDFSQKGWVSGKGRSAVWRDVPWGDKVAEPQYLMAASDYHPKDEQPNGSELRSGAKLAFMDISSATNARTMIATILQDVPCGNSAPVLRPAKGEIGLCAALNSFAYDYQARARCGGLHLNYFVIDETALPPVQKVFSSVARHAIRLAGPSRALAVLWLGTDAMCAGTWRASWAVAAHERLRVQCVLDAVLGEVYGLDFEDFAWILRNCDYAVEFLRDKAFNRTLDPKGFWRVDKDKDPELRHTVLTLAAFHDLKETIKACGGDRDRGIEAFCNQYGGEGWMLPETLCLADLGLGHDERARKPQPVRSRLGERFYPWQLEQSVEDSWKECALHARNLLGAEGFSRLQAEIRKPKKYEELEEKPPLAAEASNDKLGASRGQGSLFGSKG